MGDLPVLMLVFVATAWGVRALVPLLTDAAMSVADSHRAGGLPESASAPGGDPVRKRTEASVASALLGAGGAVALLLSVGFHRPTLLSLAAVLAAMAAYPIPAAWERRRLRLRLDRFEARLMDLTLGLANGLRSGAPLTQSLDLVARNIGGVVAEEFNTMVHERLLGTDLDESMKRLCRRMPSEDLKLLMSAIAITTRAGGSLAEVLDKITGTIRHRTEFQGKLRTMTAQGRFEAIAMAAAPLAAFGILYAIDSELMKPLVTTVPGWCALGVAVCLEIVGFFFINRIVTVEV